MALHEKHNYLNKETPYLINTMIREYDMKSGGYSILKWNGVFTDSEEDYLDNCPKYERNVYIGNKIRKEKGLSELLMEGFIEARRQFFDANMIEDSHVLSIKKDAIFLINYPVEHTKLDAFTFELKNTYSSYYLLNGKEFYYRGKTQEIDVKGINDESLEDHKEFFLGDLAKIFTLAEKGNTEYLIKYLKRYRDNYLNKRLPLATYRELNMENAFRTTYDMQMGTAYLESINEGSVLNIGYNYVRYLIPLISYYL